MAEKEKKRTVLTVDGTRFRLNGQLTYSEIPGCPEKYHGLMMNARFIQGVFDDAQDAARFHRFGREFDPEKNTDDLIAALPEWYAKGLRAFTVGFQGGGPCFTIFGNIKNTPYSPDGTSMDEAYLGRMKRIIEAADKLGMVVIVSLFYGHQVRFLQDDQAVIEATRTASCWLREQQFTNVIIEVANEHDIDPYKTRPVLYQDWGIVYLMEVARQESGGMPVGCSTTDSNFSEAIIRNSDVILIHGNNLSRQKFYNWILRTKKVCSDKPILCNEDSQALSNMQVALDECVSWGYYNNMTKQEPPTVWGITRGEDALFAARMAESLGIQIYELPKEDRFYLQGLEADEEWQGRRWIRLASMYPEQIHKVEFYRNGEYFCSAYDDPFTINYMHNWIQLPTMGVEQGEHWKAVIMLTDGTTVVKETVVG